MYIETIWDATTRQSYCVEFTSRLELVKCSRIPEMDGTFLTQLMVPFDLKDIPPSVLRKIEEAQKALRRTQLLNAD